MSHKPIRKVDDFKGQKIRVPGAAPLQVRPFEKLGAQPVSMPLGEVLSAMQNRTIDGLIASATVFTAFKYYDVAKAHDFVAGIFPDRADHGEQGFAEVAWPGTRESRA